MHYLTRKIKQLPDDEQAKVFEEIIADIAPKSKIEEIQLTLMSDFTEAAREHMKSFGRMQGISTGYSTLDRLTMGLVGGEMIVVAGKTSMGKTALSINIANNVALNGIPVLFVTMEMTHKEITARYMNINKDSEDSYDRVSALTLFQKNDELNWQSIDALVEKAKDEMGVGLVIVDHLHYFTRELDNVAEDLGRITKEIKKNAIRHDVPIILISHVRKTQGEADIESLRGSSLIAQDADIVLMVGRNPDTSQMMVKIEKNRNRGFDHENNETELTFDGIRLTERSSWNT
jgi:replicative DNA helicase